MNQISAGALQQRLQTSEILNLLDVREAIEFHTFNIGGINVPVSKIAANIHLITYNKNDEIIVICRIGMRSENAGSVLSRLGYANVVNLKGGLIALQKLNNN